MTSRRYALRRDANDRTRNGVIVDRFLSYVQPVTESGCWLYDGASTGNGYGKFSVRNKTYRAHRWAYEHFIGALSAEQVVCHRCDVPCCVNPDHLYAANHAANVADKVTKGRQAKGASCGRAKLTDDQIIAIRASGASLTEIGRQFGVHRSLVKRIKLRKAWRHVA
jgi:hypothetical protein